MDSLTQKQAIGLVHGALPEDGTDETFWKRREGENCVEQFFSSIRRGGEPLAGWRHFHPVRESESLYSVEYHRDDLRRDASNYIENLKPFHCRQLDWLIVDVLMYAEISAFALTLKPFQTMEPSHRRWLRVLGIFWRLIKWSVFAVVLMASIAFELPLVAWGITLLAVAWQGLKLRGKLRVAKLLHTMFDAYAAAGSWSLSWSILWELLEKSRNLGAYWDPEVYRLVELRMKTA